MRIRILFAPLLIIALGLPLATAAQEPDSGAAAAAQGAFTEQQLNQFADAYGSILGIQKDYAKRLQSVKDRDKAMALQKEANQQMLQAVRDSGLSLEEYRMIASAASQNPELAQKIQGML